MTPEISQRLSELRVKQRAGVQLSIEEMREALALMRDGREKAQATSTKSKSTKAAKAKPVDSDALLDELGLE